jgi:hypothetical protein
MFVSSWFPWRLVRQHKGRSRPSHAPALRRRGIRLACEQLEDRTVPSNFLTAATVTDLISDINTANSFGGSNTIALVAGTTFTLTSSGLPIIAANDSLTILGNGDTIERSTAAGTPDFRIFEVAGGASLTLASVTVQGGLVPGAGGGVYSSGSLTLEAGTIIRGNGAFGAPGDFWYGSSTPGGNAYGGGVYVAGGTATLTNVTLSSNSVQGGAGPYYPDGYNAGPGGNGFGGGLYVAGGTVTLSNVTVSSNSALGGVGLSGGNGYGGGVCVVGGSVTLINDTLSSNSAVGGGGGVSPFQQRGMGGTGFGGGLAAAGGTVTLRSDTVTGNFAQGGAGVKPRYNGGSDGGGLYIDPAAVVYLDAFTLAHTKNNRPGNIDGSYILIT